MNQQDRSLTPWSKPRLRVGLQWSAPNRPLSGGHGWLRLASLLDEIEFFDVREGEGADGGLVGWPTPLVPAAAKDVELLLTVSAQGAERARAVGVPAWLISATTLGTPQMRVFDPSAGMDAVMGDVKAALRDWAEGRRGPTCDLNARASDSRFQELRRLFVPAQMDAAGVLLDLVLRHRGIVYAEGSFKLKPGALLQGRALLGVYRKDFGSGFDAWVGEVLAALQMPAGAQRPCLGDVSRTTAVAFSVETDADGRRVWKIHVEFLPTQNGGVLFRAYKWREGSDEFATGKYAGTVGLSREVILERMTRCFGTRADVAVTRSLDQILRVVARAAKIEQQQLVEADEVLGSRERAFFTLRGYGTRLRVEPIGGALADIADHWGIAQDVFFAAYDASANELLGHIGGGIDRDGEPAVTVYYGLRPVIAL